MGQMVMQYPGDLRSNRRISDIINGSQLHRFQVALHFELPRHHDDGQPAIDLLLLQPRNACANRRYRSCGTSWRPSTCATWWTIRG